MIARYFSIVSCWFARSDSAIDISYDERSLSLVRTIGMEAWDIDFVRSRDVVAQVRDRCARLENLASLCTAAAPRWRQLETVMSGTTSEFAGLVTACGGGAGAVIRPTADSQRPAGAGSDA